MNREIKFRVYDNDKKEMNSDITGLEFCDGELTGVFVDGDFVKSSYVMQYTGLKDKNGVEIYEGDIIEFKDSTGLHRQEVKFDYGCFYAGFHNGSSTRYAPKLINTRITKVIGNIFENKELLENEN